MRLAIAILLNFWCLSLAAESTVSLPAESPAPQSGFADTKAVRTRIADSGPHRIEGIWQFPGSGATVAIERITDRSKLPGAVTYNMVVVRSENRTIKPGTLMGVLAPTAKSNTYDAAIYTSAGRKARLTAPKHFTLTLGEENSRLIFKRVKSKYSLNLWRILPYMFRYAVRQNNNTGEAPVGCIKIFPLPDAPSEPRYL
ncbi:MAG: hypothetical protein HDT08_01545 [Bacteroidales bacterium]|nr:hypothetical protein [Bacteroidales bacterium]